jgi:hypothetical protein
VREVTFGVGATMQIFDEKADGGARVGTTCLLLRGAHDVRIAMDSFSSLHWNAAQARRFGSVVLYPTKR